MGVQSTMTDFEWVVDESWDDGDVWDLRNRRGTCVGFVQRISAERVVSYVAASRKRVTGHADLRAAARHVMRSLGLLSELPR